MEDGDDDERRRYRNKGKAEMEYHPELHEEDEKHSSSSDTSGDTMTKCIKRFIKSTRPHHNPYHERGEVSSRCSAPIDDKLPTTNIESRGDNDVMCTDAEMPGFIPSTPPKSCNDSAPEYVMAEMRRLVRAMAATVQVPRRRATVRIGDTIKRAPLAKTVSEKVESSSSKKKRKLILKINTTKSTLRVEEREVDEEDDDHAANEHKRAKNINQDKDVGPPNA